MPRPWLQRVSVVERGSLLGCEREYMAGEALLGVTGKVVVFDWLV